MTVSNYTLAHELSSLFPGLREVVSCPECQNPESVFSVIQHLNDYHSGWSRERIADWLETLDTNLTMIEGEKYDEALANIHKDREQMLSRSPAQLGDVLLSSAKSPNPLFAKAWLDEIQATTWTGKSEEELLKERLGDALQVGLTKVQESLTQLGDQCATALEAIQKFTINYEEIVKKEQAA